jgi:hypothetical protein
VKRFRIPKVGNAVEIRRRDNTQCSQEARKSTSLKIELKTDRKKATRRHSVKSGSTQVHVFEYRVEDGQRKEVKHLKMHTVCMNTQ